jgi:prepilin-type N-terminal cleavage/methylation domain-containing protein
MIEKNENKGFTLVELIIAIAMLAFLMTAVCSFMTSGIASYKKAKADIRVHNSAQENYDKISDAIMEARNIYLCGYEEGNKADAYWYVRDEEQKTSLMTDLQLNSKFGINVGVNVDEGHIRYFQNVSSSTKIYIRAIVIDTATPIVVDNIDATDLSKLDNALTFAEEETKISKAKRKVTTKNEDTGDVTVSYNDVQTSLGDDVYDTSDTVRQVFYFDDCNMYYMTKYAYGTKADDNPVSGGLVTSGSTADASVLENYLYSSSFGVTSDGITDCYMCVDSDSDALSVELGYSDKNMTYTTDGEIRTRNSFVIKPKKVQLTDEAGDSTDTTAGDPDNSETSETPGTSEESQTPDEGGTPGGETGKNNVEGGKEVI